MIDRSKASGVLGAAIRSGRGELEVDSLMEHIASALAEARAEERKRIVRWLRQNESGPCERLAAAIEQDKMQE
jgi:hypothetical protein